MGKPERVRGRRRIPHADKREPGAAADLQGHIGSKAVGDDNGVPAEVGSERTGEVLFFGTERDYHGYFVGSESLSGKQGQTPQPPKLASGRT